MNEMNRIVYKKSDHCWVDKNGARDDVHLTADETDYYYAINDLGIVFRCFDSQQNWDKALGVIYHFNGNKVQDIPLLIHPDYNGSRTMYKSRISWIEGCKDGNLVFVIDCTVLEGFRSTMNLQTMKFTGFSFGIR